MAETKSPLAAVMANVPTIDLSKINPTGIGTDPEITAEYKNLMEAQKKYADELEQRYAQPNWFKVAAGFAKPQLGGFLASLGTASEAMGENVEQQRAIAPTVAAMRAEIAKGNIGLTQGLQAAKIAERATKEGRLPTGVEASQIAALTGGPGSAAKSGQEIQSAQIHRTGGELRQRIHRSRAPSDAANARRQTTCRVSGCWWCACRCTWCSCRRSLKWYSHSGRTRL